MGTPDENNRINEMNAMAVAQNLADLRDVFGERITVLENKLAAIETLMQNQNRVLGEALQMAYGRGSTVRDPEE